MRWYRKTERVIKKFALSPIEIGMESRWLEIVYIRQIYRVSASIFDSDWVNDMFVDRDIYLRYKRNKRSDKDDQML